MPVLGDPPNLGKQSHGRRGTYYIVILQESQIFRGFECLRLTVLQSASYRITCKRTYFRQFWYGIAVYGLHPFHLIL